MQALISGRSGIAVLHEADRWFTLQAEAPEAAIPCHPALRNRLLEVARDLVFLDDTDFTDAGQRLKREHMVARALDTFLFLIDADLPDPVREDAAVELLPFLSEAERRLADILFARPLPAQADMEGAFNICMQCGAERLLVFLQTLSDSQPFIRQVFEAWRNIPETAFTEEGTREQAQSLFAREGLFYDLVDVSRQKQRSGAFLVTALSLPEIHFFSNHRTILQAWVRPFEQAERMDADMVLESPSSQGNEEDHRQNAKPRIHPTFEIKQRVDRQKESIVEAIRLGQQDRARDYVGDLIRFQLDNGDSEFACKSLCDLAIEAQDLSQFYFQYWLTSKAVELKPDDGWSWAQHGKALHNLNRLPEAMKSYEEALNWIGDAAAKCGRAEVLKALNRLPEALTAYDAIIAEHPEDVFANNGRAEVLKALNRLPEALTAYDAIIVKHPEVVVAKCGRAEVLKALNRLPEALTAYDAIIAEHPEDIFAKNGRAEVLKALNRLPEALTAYDAIIAEHPEDVFAKNGRAEVLKALNRLPEALTAYDAIIVKHPEDVIAKNGRAEVLKALNRLPEALTAYDGNIGKHPEDIFAKNGRAEVLKALNRLPEALTAYDAIIAEHPEDVVAKNGRAEVLKALNRLPEALTAYDAIIAEHPAAVVAKSGRAEVLKALNRLPEALTAYDAIITEHPADVVAKCGRAEVLKALNRLPEALAVCHNIFREYPWDSYAKNSLATILAMTGKLEQALAVLPNAVPITSQDWVSYHIRGMILLRQGNAAEAIRVFERGVEQNPRPADRDSFYSALAIIFLRQHKQERASQVLEKVNNPALLVPATILQVHAWGMIGEEQRLSEIRTIFPVKVFPLIQPLRDEIDRRYLQCQPAHHDDEWLFQREVEMLLAA